MFVLNSNKKKKRKTRTKRATFTEEFFFILTITRSNAKYTTVFYGFVNRNNVVMELICLIFLLLYVSEVISEMCKILIHL